MLRKGFLCFAVALSLSLASFACGPKPPTQEISDAQAALESARKAGAESLYADEYKAAEAALSEALARLREKKYDEARKFAADAKSKADDLTERIKKLALPPPESPTEEAKKAAQPPPPGVEAATITGEGRVLTRESAATPDEQLSLKRVYFAYDDYTLSEEAKSTLRANSEWLLGHPTIRIQIEGHCDERGTNEYNLALGERRALGVRDYLVALGVSAERLSVLSFGEEIPLDPGHDEAALARNRRAQFVYLGD